ncbi:MAG: BlaI/MecI/CopY family transcriptional regulator, partial [Bacteroidota bacterium]
MRTLTKAEEQIMQVLWTLERAFVKEVIAELPDPKPAYNTVSTIIRILEKKEFVGYEAFGKTHRYHPLISREAYSKASVNRLVDNYFGGSFERLVSFFVRENNLDLQEIDELRRLL